MGLSLIYLYANAHGLRCPRILYHLPSSFQMSPQYNLRACVYLSSALFVSYASLFEKQQQKEHKTLYYVRQRNKVQASRTTDQILKRRCL